MQPHNFVSREEWIAARKAHLAHEKEYTRARDRLSEERRALPWARVDKDYVFEWIGCGYVTSTIRHRFRHPAAIASRTRS